MNRYCIIMAGGVGTRFWPLSRQNKPKQFLDIMGTGKSFLRHTFERFAPLVPDENFIVVTNRRYKELIRNILPEIREEQILCEPIGRNTAPAIAYAAYWLRKHDPEAQMIVTPADHWVVDEEGFRSIIGECLDFVTGHDALMTVGIRPTRPETGYGYIQASADETICPVKSFTEKPNLELAQTFVQCGEFFWNSGIFVWKVRDIVRAFAQYLPEHHALFSSVEAAFGTPQEDEAVEPGLFVQPSHFDRLRRHGEGRQRLRALQRRRGLERRGDVGFALPALAQGPLRQRQACGGLLRLRYAQLHHLAARRQGGRRERVEGVHRSSIRRTC